MADLPYPFNFEASPRDRVSTPNTKTQPIETPKDAVITLALRFFSGSAEDVKDKFHAVRELVDELDDLINADTSADKQSDQKTVTTDTKA